MTIKRTINGNEIEIELMDDEIEQAYRIRDLYYHTEDVKMCFIDLYNKAFPYDDHTAQCIAERAMDIEGKNDGFYEYYWENIKVALEEFEKEDNNS